MEFERMLSNLPENDRKLVKNMNISHPKRSNFLRNTVENLGILIKTR